MALAPIPSGYYVNADGLMIKYGTTEGIPNKVGSYQDTHLGDSVVCVELDYSLFTGITATNAVIVDYDTKLPAGAIIDHIVVVTDKAFNTLTTIDVGLVRADYSTTYDEDGLIVTLPLASINSVGERTEIVSTTSTYPGALWNASTGTALANAGFVVASYAGTAPTTGNLKLFISYHILPSKDNGNKSSDV